MFDGCFQHVSLRQIKHGKLESTEYQMLIRHILVHGGLHVRHIGIMADNDVLNSLRSFVVTVNAELEVSNIPRLAKASQPIILAADKPASPDSVKSISYRQASWNFRNCCQDRWANAFRCRLISASNRGTYVPHSNQLEPSRPSVLVNEVVRLNVNLTAKDQPQQLERRIPPTGPQ